MPESRPTPEGALLYEARIAVQKMVEREPDVDYWTQLNRRIDAVLAARITPSYGDAESRRTWNPERPNDDFTI